MYVYIFTERIAFRLLVDQIMGSHVTMGASEVNIALQDIVVGRPDLVLADWDTVDAAKLMQELRRLRSVLHDFTPPPVVFTATVTGSEARLLHWMTRAASHGARAFIPQPITDNDLRLTIQAMLRGEFGDSNPALTISVLSDDVVFAAAHDLPLGRLAELIGGIEQLVLVATQSGACRITKTREMLYEALRAWDVLPLEAKLARAREYRDRYSTPTAGSNPVGAALATVASQMLHRFPAAA